jgi:alpha-tubulin suppressor-like RCC1 family protein
MKIWVANENSYFFYILGNNGELYSFVANKLLSGNSTIATSAATLNFFKPSKVNLPIGEAAKIIKIDTDGRTIFAVTSAGNLYAWGIVKFDYGASAGASYGTTYECMFNDQTGITIVPNEYGHRTYYAYDPKLVKLPAGETKFVDVTAAFTNNFFICVSGVGYTLGYENNSGEGGVYGTPSNGYISYTNYQKTLAIENVSAVSIRSSGFATLVLDSSGKLWGFGDNVYCMSGGGYLCPKSLFTALPLMNGNLDPNNPRPQTVN